MSKLRLEILPTGNAGECPMDQLVRQISLRISADSPRPEGADQVGTLESQNDPHSSGVATSMVVHRPASPVIATTSQIAVQAGPSVEIRRPDGSPQSLLLEFGSMAPQLVQYGHLNLPPDCLDILKKAKRPSTCSAYAFKWKRFCLWCSSNNVNPTTCQEDVILPYLLHLAKAGLQFSSIKVHLAAITAY